MLQEDITQMERVLATSFDKNIAHPELYDPESEALLYLDDIGIDTAHSHGVDIHWDTLNEHEQANMLVNGHTVTEDNRLLAFGSFLMRMFIERAELSVYIQDTFGNGTTVDQMEDAPMMGMAYDGE